MAQLSDKVFLRREAERLARELRALLSGYPLSFKRQLSSEETFSGGWGITLATMGAAMPKLELWLDRWVGGDTRAFWYGFAGSSANIVNNVAQNCPREWRASIKLTDKDTQKKKGIWSLKRPLLAKDARRPIFEEYKSDHCCYFGIYQVEPRGGLPLDVDRAATFFEQVVRSVPKFGDIAAIDHDLEGSPRDVQRRERSRSIQLIANFIQERVKSGRLVCDACSFDPRKPIGDHPIEPRSLLDVHHKNPLALGARQTQLSDLTLLCPTCHRFEHARLRLELAV